MSSFTFYERNKSVLGNEFEQAYTSKVSYRDIILY